jgi:transposase InsO family protein
VEGVLEARKRHPSWGPKKLVAWLECHVPGRTWPAASTAGEILKRHGLVRARPFRRRLEHPGRSLYKALHPNDLWTADFKGQFRTGDARYCYPLTVADSVSRYLLGCQALRSSATQPTRASFQRLFEEYGLPRAIRTDNGAPFASVAMGRLSALSVWWIRLGILPVLIEPSHPEQNASHERMHRTLKEETARPPHANLPAQQRRFDHFRLEYNEQRPHESLGQKSPASAYRPSPRPYPQRLEPLDYPGHFEVRRVGSNGCISWNAQWLHVTQALADQDVGLEEIDDGIWSVHFGPMLLGRFHQGDVRLRGVSPS